MTEQTSSKTITNAKTLPKVYYGIHFYPGVAEYAEPGKEPFRIMLNEQTLRDMDASFCGCPVYVRHKDEVNLAKLQEEADGYVVESFYNEVDGKHWVKFIVVSDRGHAAIQNGWKLSNAYIPEAYGPGGLWNGVEYQKEVTRGKFEHLAIVPDPRYQESNVLTPAEFKTYNHDRIMSLQKVANSKEKPTMFEFFKKTKIDGADLGDTVVKLPKSGKEVSIAQLINAMDMEKESEREEKESDGKKNSDPEDEDKDKQPAKKDADGKSESDAEEKKQGRKEEDDKHEAPMMANMEHHVMDGEKSRPIHEIMKEHNEMRDCMNKLAMHHHAMKMNDEEMDGGEHDAEESQDADLTKRNADEDGGEKEAVSQWGGEADLTKKNSKKDIKHFNNLKFAPNKVLDKSEPAVDLDKAERGKARYGSGN